MAGMKYFYELTISSSPHVHCGVTTRTVMRDVLIALTPALVGSLCFFGPRALTVTLVSMAACVFFEWGWCQVTKQHCKIHDLSCLVTGMLIAFVCPVTVPYGILIVGDFFAIIVVKMLFGGVGTNLVNPALAARAFLFSWPVAMTTWVKPGLENAPGLLGAADAVTAATPLAAMHQGILPEQTLWQLFLGNVGGCLGETSGLLLLVGFGYLLARRVITPRIPLIYVGTVAALTLLFPRGNEPLLWCAAQVCSGGLLLGAIFMATDYVTSPLTARGQAVYALGCGLLTVAIRYFGGYNEGVSYAILMMNCCVVLFDRIGRPRKFGAPGKKGARKS